MKIATDRKFKNPDDILQYEGMVNTIVAGYFRSGIPRDELISEAWIGVIRALQTFNKSKGMKQSSWIYLNIKYSIRTAVTMRGRYAQRTILGTDTFALNTDSSCHRTSPNENDLAMDEELLYSAFQNCPKERRLFWSESIYAEKLSRASQPLLEFLKVGVVGY